ncbi:DUF397 domain-containing protein [Streptomyces sp. SudanB25_2051]|uniref:DUF397 domain-containing protein n=1 Tax=Streptomyces sp. SudanB25_2051 TaxID=3035275 RepID=UPI003F56D634
MREVPDRGPSLEWFKSSYSDTSNPNDCVEVAMVSGAVYVRDSKDCDGPRLAVAPCAWGEFLGYLVSGG